MKTLSEGNPDWKPSWIGKVMECPECGCRVELEAGDLECSSVMTKNGKPKKVWCPRCYGRMVESLRDQLMAQSEKRDLTLFDIITTMANLVNVMRDCSLQDCWRIRETVIILDAELRRRVKDGQK